MVTFSGSLKHISNDGHFTDASDDDYDKVVADAIAYEIGDTFISFTRDSPVVQWEKVVKALRVHGIKIEID